MFEFRTRAKAVFQIDVAVYFHQQHTNPGLFNSSLNLLRPIYLFLNVCHFSESTEEYIFMDLVLSDKHLNVYWKVLKKMSANGDNMLIAFLYRNALTKVSEVDTNSIIWSFQQFYEVITTSAFLSYPRTEA